MIWKTDDVQLQEWNIDVGTRGRQAWVISTKKCSEASGSSEISFRHLLSSHRNYTFSGIFLRSSQGKFKSVKFCLNFVCFSTRVYYRWNDILNMLTKMVMLILLIYYVYLKFCFQHIFKFGMLKTVTEVQVLNSFLREIFWVLLIFLLRLLSH